MRSGQRLHFGVSTQHFFFGSLATLPALPAFLPAFLEAFLEAFFEPTRAAYRKR
jgi:hypothetical protein